MASGSTSQGRNGAGHLVPLLDIYGIQHLTIPTTPETTFTFSIDGTFKIREANLFFIQNFTKGFLFLFHLPVRNLQIKDVSFTNLSQPKPSEPIKSLLRSQGFDTQSSHETGSGDFTALLEWTHNYQNTTTLDFVDSTLATGFLAPTGKTRNPKQLFSLPLGYNGHWAIPLSAQLSFGLYEWITLGISIDSLLFFKNTATLRIKTTPEETGLIKPTIANVTVHKGPVWDAQIFLKADHFMYGLSFIAGYSCAGEQKSTITTANPTFFDESIINSDPALHNWYMHTLHFGAEYDFAKQYSRTGLRIGFFYNYQFGGIRTFDANMVGGSFGIDATWGF